MATRVRVCMCTSKHEIKVGMRSVGLSGWMVSANASTLAANKQAKRMELFTSYKPHLLKLSTFHRIENVLCAIRVFSHKRLSVIPQQTELTFVYLSRTRLRNPKPAHRTSHIYTTNPYYHIHELRQGFFCVLTYKHTNT